MSCPLTKTFVTKEPLICVRPQNLYGETTLKEDGTFGATLIWPYVKEWLYYDNGTPEKTFGGNNNQVYWGIMFPAKDLAKYAGTNLTKFALYNKNAGDATLTYRELDQKANVIANSLIDKGVKPKSNVLIMLSRDSNLIASILGILKFTGRA